MLGQITHAKTGPMNRYAIVTGSTTGIGFETSKSFLASGYNVVLNGRRIEKIQESKEALSPLYKDQFCIVQGDVSSEETQHRLFNRCNEQFSNQPDIVVVNAGRGLAGSVVSADLTKFEELVRTNLIAATSLLQLTARNFIARRKDGYPLTSPLDIVLIGSISGKQISPWSGVYGSTKFALGSLAESLRREIAPHGIRVTLVAPAIVESDFQDSAGYDKEWFASIKEKIGPLLLPEDIARVISFIVSQPAHVHVNDVIIRPTRQEYP